MMRLLLVSDAHWDDHAGGISMSIRNEIAALTEGRPEVKITCLFRSFGGAKIGSEFRGATYKYWGPARKTWLYGLYPLLCIIPYLWSCFRLSAFAFDCVYIHNTIQAFLWSIFIRQPYVFCYHASIVQELEIDRSAGKYGKWGGIVGRILTCLRAIESMTLQRASAIVVRSSFMRRDMLRRYPQTVTIRTFEIPLAGPQSCATAPRSVRIRKELGIPHNAIVLLTIRRLTSRMGLENLIRAMARLRQFHGESIVLLIGGRGYLQEKLEMEAVKLGLGRTIRFLGYLPEMQKREYYDAADLFVLPTEFYEGFGLVVLEAWAQGCPVLATPVGALPDVVGVMGKRWLCRDSSADAIAAGIQTIMRSVNLNSAREAVLETYRCFFEPATVASRLFQAFAAVDDRRSIMPL